MRKEEIFFDAITALREDLVEAAQNYAFRRRVRWERWAGLAACLVLAAFLSLPFVLPSGGSGGDLNGASGSADQAAPMSPEAAPPAEAPAGDGGEVSGEPAPGASEGTALLRFEATVLEVRENTLLVEPDPAAGVAVQAEVPLEGVEELPVLRAGDRITIVCSGVQETEPARLTGVLEITLTESSP